MRLRGGIGHCVRVQRDRRPNVYVRNNRDHLATDGDVAPDQHFVGDVLHEVLLLYTENLGNLSEAAEDFNRLVNVLARDVGN